MFGEQGVQVLDPSSEYFPAAHHAHIVCDWAPGWAENVPFGHSWHVRSLIAPTASENVPGPHRVHTDTSDAFDQVPCWHWVHPLDAFVLEKVP